MITVKEILDKFNIPVTFSKTLMDYDIGKAVIGDNIDELKEYHTETHDGNIIHVVVGYPEERENYELIFNPKNNTVEWFCPPEDEYDGKFPRGYILIDNEGNVTEYN